jgi:hypothetical protein
MDTLVSILLFFQNKARVVNPRQQVALQTNRQGKVKRLYLCLADETGAQDG